MKRVGAIAWRDLRVIENQLLTLAAAHRDTVMAGRTHGQPGSLITFGLKAVSWADEVRRHLERLREGAPRWLVGQLAGAVGSLGFFGNQGLELRKRVLRAAGARRAGCLLDQLPRPAGRVLPAARHDHRDAGADRIGGLRAPAPEIGELSEGAAPGAVSSITMPHKQNPEAAEHLVTLSRLRGRTPRCCWRAWWPSTSGRRSWKAEWPAFSETCLLAGASLSLAKDLLAGLQVHPRHARQH